MSLGYLFSIIVKKSVFSDKNVFYFYYNFGITQIGLFGISGIINIVLGISMIIGYIYAK